MGPKYLRKAWMGSRCGDGEIKGEFGVESNNEGW